MTDAEWQSRIEASKGLEELVTESSIINNWPDFQSRLGLFNRSFCFRGHREATWDLVPTYWRKIYQRWKTTESESVGTINPEENERQLLREFQRAAHHYYSVLPARDQIVDWFALMQHHGAPTRMLDWTRSPYVALYFAMQDDSESDAALWAIDLDWLRMRSSELLRPSELKLPEDSDFDAFREYINQILLRADNPLVIVPAVPIQVNERMLIQQGELLCNLSHNTAFPNVLFKMLYNPSPVTRPVVSRFVVSKAHRIKFLEELRRMNIHEGSLFPGLDGFARSLGLTLDIRVSNQIEEQKRDNLQAFQKRKAGSLKR